MKRSRKGHLSIFRQKFPNRLNFFKIPCAWMNYRAKTGYITASLHTQTELRFLPFKSWTQECLINVWYTSFTSVHWYLEPGLVTLTESFSPLESEFTQPSLVKSKWEVPWYPFCHVHEYPSEPIWTGHGKPELDMFKSWDVDLIYVCFPWSNLDTLYIKMTGLMSWFQI